MVTEVRLKNGAVLFVMLLRRDGLSCGNKVSVAAVGVYVAVKKVGCCYKVFVVLVE